MGLVNTGYVWCHMGKQFGGARIGKRDPPPCPPRQSTVALLTQHATKHRTMAEPQEEPHDDEVRFRLIAALVPWIPPPSLAAPLAWPAR